MIGIYKIENLVNGKKYIGQSVDIESRWTEHQQIAFRETEAAAVCQKYPLYRAFKKYGLENFDFSVIEEISKEQLDERERYWIEYYNTYIKKPDSWGYNLTRGGDGHRSLPQEYVDWFITLWNQGLITSEIEKITGKDKHVIIRYLKEYEPSYSVEESRRRGCASSGVNHRKQVLQYDYLGRFIKSYESVKQLVAETKYTHSSITGCMKKRQKGAYGYYFVSDEADLKDLMNMRPRTGLNPILQLTMDDKLAGCYPSMSIASEKSEVPYGSISACCSGAVKSGHGYKWRYLVYDDIEKYNLKEEIPFEGDNQ